MTETLRTQLFLKTLYNEASAAKVRLAQQLIDSNWSCREEFNLLEEAKEALPQLGMSPAQSVLNTIMHYSRQQTRLQLS